jgi:hypothetical protein
VAAVCRFPEAKLWKVQGVDAVFYLRSLKLFIMLTVGMNIGSLMVLLPINLTAEPALLAPNLGNSTSYNDTASSNTTYHAASDYYLDEGADLENGTVSGMARFTMASLKSGRSLSPLARSVSRVVFLTRSHILCLHCVCVWAQQRHR